MCGLHNSKSAVSKLDLTGLSDLNDMEGILDYRCDCCQFDRQAQNQVPYFVGEMVPKHWR